MFVFLSEFILFIMLIGVVIYSFTTSENSMKIDEVGMKKILYDLHMNDYTDMQINTNIHPKTSVVYKEVILTFQDGDLNENLCDIINQK